MPVTPRAVRFFTKRAPAERLAAARIAIGISSFGLAWESWRALDLILTPLSVPLPYLVSLPRLPVAGLPIFASVWFASASVFVVGFATRVSGLLLTSLSAYTLLLDQRTYSNHLYLFVLIAGMLTVGNCGAAWSVDSRQRSDRSGVAAWPISLLKLQASLVYGFSAVAKLTPDFLAGQVLAPALKTAGWFVVPPQWRTALAMSALAITAIVAELFVALGLWIPRVRWLAVVTGVLLHTAILTLIDSSRLSLGIFALEMFALYGLFFDEHS